MKNTSEHARNASSAATEKTHHYLSTVSTAAVSMSLAVIQSLSLHYPSLVHSSQVVKTFTSLETLLMAQFSR